MGRLLLILFFCSSFIVSSQKENALYNAVASQFMQKYNAEDYDGIFEMFNADMQKALPREQTFSLFKGQINAPLGQIKQMDFSRIQNGAHIYKTTFNKGVIEILISLDGQQRVNGLYIFPPKNEAPSSLIRNSTNMTLPFEGEWFVFWGGETIENNYHVAEDSQKYAYDILKVANGKSYEGDPSKNENYFAFGEDILAPCDAKVVKVITGVQDNLPGETNPIQLTGNTIVLQTINDEFILFAHLKEGSIVVEKDQEVRTGQKLAECGNSGNSTEPHLHLSLQNTRDMNKATGGKLYFNRILVNGEEKEDYLPIKEDFVRNID